MGVTSQSDKKVVGKNNEESKSPIISVKIQKGGKAYEFHNEFHNLFLGFRYGQCS